MQQQLKPRVYKKAADTIVDASARSVLVMVLVVGICYEAMSGAQGEGDPITPDASFCDACATEIAFQPANKLFSVSKRRTTSTRSNADRLSVVVTG